MMDIYTRLGVRKIVNACGFATELGGSLMAPEVLEAMAQASRWNVDMRELHEKAGKRVAELIGAEAACITSCAAAGVCISIAACITGKDPDKIRKIPEMDGDRKEVIIQAAHRSPFDHAVRQTGAKLVVIGTREHVAPEHLESAINSRTVAMVYVYDTHLPAVTLPFDQVIDICHTAGVPVVVDTAAELPPPSNLQEFLKAGADLVVFSGGKGLHGPQSSGMILGRKDLIEACALNSAPNADTIGRSMKVGKEEIAGGVMAVELYLKRDHDAVSKGWEETVSYIIKGLEGLPGVKAKRVFPMGKFRPIPFVSITLDRALAGQTPSDVVKQLRDGEPPILISHPDTLPVPTFTGGKDRYDEEESVVIKPQSLKEGDAEIVIKRLREILGA
jgi:L-seryl-tRNA(Ser) seleniumtransferase